jgi:hypothetical protein
MRFFIGIDSEGCAFDTMEIKHKECFIPSTIKYWDLQAVSKYAREAAEFVNLYSKVARYQPLGPRVVMVFDLLRGAPGGAGAARRPAGSAPPARLHRRRGVPQEQRRVEGL